MGKSFGKGLPFCARYQLQTVTLIAFTPHLKPPFFTCHNEFRATWTFLLYHYYSFMNIPNRLIPDILKIYMRNQNEWDFISIKDSKFIFVSSINSFSFNLINYHKLTSNILFYPNALNFTNMVQKHYMNLMHVVRTQFEYYKLLSHGPNYASIGDPTVQLRKGPFSDH